MPMMMMINKVVTSFIDCESLTKTKTKTKTKTYLRYHRLDRAPCKWVIKLAVKD
ncbi:MAG: hypothetical protein ACI8QG_002420 [Flavobacteriales bacterium]|jgi:hypothetical protein